MPEVHRLPILPSLGMVDTVHELRGLAIRLAGGIIAILTAIAVADFTYQKLSFLRSMRICAARCNSN